MEWYINENSFVIEQKQSSITWVITIIFMMLFFSFFIFFIYFILTIIFSFGIEGNFPLQYIFSFSLLLSMLLFWYLIKDTFFYKPLISIDKTQEKVKFYSNKNILVYELHLNEVSHLLFEHYVEAGSHGATHFYNSYFVKKDSSIFKIYETNFQYEQEEFINQLTNFTRLSKTYLHTRLNQVAFVPNIKLDKKIFRRIENFHFVKEKKSYPQTIFSLYKKPSLFIITLLIFEFLVLIIGMFTYFKKTFFHTLNFSELFAFILIAIIFISVLYFIYFIHEFLFSPFPYKSTLIINSNGIEVRKFYGVFTKNKQIKKKEILNFNINRNTKNYKPYWSLNLFVQSENEISILELFSIPEALIGKDEYYNRNILYEFEFLISKILEHLEK